MTLPAPERPGSKAGRNEQRKLAATFLNNVAVGCLLAAFLQPALAYMQASREVTLAERLGSAILLMVSLGLFLAGRSLAGRLED